MGATVEDIPGIWVLSELLDENEGIKEVGYTDLKPKSTRMPPQLESPEMYLFFKIVSNEFEKMGQQNLVY